MSDKPRWERTPDGFLRTTIRVLKEGVMPYHRDELNGLPDTILSDMVGMMVSLDTMGSAESLRTLEGVPVVTGDHVWVTPDNARQVSQGNVAGSPRIDGPYVVCDLLITDPIAIQDIESGKYSEISAAYAADALFENGCFDGQDYDAKQVHLKYNHIAVIPEGHGRAGLDVKILNKDKTNESGGRKMAKEDLVKVKLRNGKYINTDEDGAKAIEEDNAATEESTKESSKSLEASMEQLESKNGELAAVQSEVEELKGELSVYKEKLDELLSDEAIEAAAAGMIEEQDEASEILENSLIKDGEGKELDGEAKMEIKNSIKSIHGEKLHRKVLELVGVQVENMSAEGVKGAFKAHSQILKNSSGKVAGQKMMNSMQPKEAEVKAAQVQVRNSRERLGLK